MTSRDGVVLCDIRSAALSKRAVITRLDVKVRNACNDV